MTRTFTVGYRRGGTANFTWYRTIAFTTREEAEQVAASIIRGGRLAYVYRTADLDAIGLPDTFAPESAP